MVTTSTFTGINLSYKYVILWEHQLAPYVLDIRKKIGDAICKILDVDTYKCDIHGRTK